MTYAKRTEVPVTKSKGEIEVMVKKYGADAFAVMEAQGRVRIAFSLQSRNILFEMPIPEDEQAERSIWRAMLLSIKGKLESAERGIETLEEAFLANIVMPSGETVGQATIPAIGKHYEGNPNVPLLPAP